MKIAIHRREGSFSDRWINYCQKENLNFLIVNCFDTDIVQELVDNKVTHLMWHFNHSSSKDLQVFPYVFNAAENLGIQTFPNMETRWHFDDKIAQKYLLESINAPLARSYVFYESSKAKEFIENIQFPIVAKLRRGAGSANVELLKDKGEACQYIEKMFTAGRNYIPNILENFGQKLRLAKKIMSPIGLFAKFFQYFKNTRYERLVSNTEKGYVYFQKYLTDNDYDTRIIVIGEIAFGIRRFNRDHDFRASGSGKLDFTASEIDPGIVRIAFETSDRLNTQCLAYDFVYEKGKPRIIEVCFGFSMLAYDKCEGYWDKNLNFMEGKFNPQEIMIKDFIAFRKTKILTNQ